MIDWPDGAPTARLDDPPPAPRLRSLHRRRPRWPLLTRRRARWAVAINLCHSRGPRHSPAQPPGPLWRQGCCGECWEHAETWLSARV